MGQYLLDGLKERKLSARGMGLMIGIEFVKDKKSKEKTPKLRNAIVKNAVQKQKLWILGAGQNVVRFTPSYVITKENIDDAVNRLDKAVTEETR